MDSIRIFRRWIPVVADVNCRLFKSTGKVEKITGPLEMSIRDELSKTFGHPKLLEKIFKSNPDLLNSNMFFWKSFIKSLAGFGFGPKDCFNMINTYPEILTCNENSLEKILSHWKSYSTLSFEDFQLLMVKRPEFLTVRLGNIKKRVPFFLEMCKKTDKFMIFLFLCPNVMFDEWNDIMNKLKYLNEEMVVRHAEIFSTQAMSKSLTHMKIRFSILEKCGVYTKPNPYFNKQTVKEKINLNNPHLRLITDSNDQRFAKNVARISLEEYEVYADMFIANQELQSDDDDDDDEVSDDEIYFNKN